MTFGETIVVSIIGIIGVLVGAGINHFSSSLMFNRQEEKEKKKFFISRQEELFETLVLYRDIVLSIILKAVCHIDPAHKIAYAYGAKPIETREEEEPTVFGKLKRLISFYAPELKAYLNEISIFRTELIRKAIEVAASRPTGKDKEESLKFFDQKAGSLKLLLDKMEDSIEGLSKKYI